MSEQSIFNADKAVQDNTQNPATTQTQTTSPDLEELVGDGKKYKTVDELAKAYKNADQFINTLKTENATLKETQTKTKTVEELLEEFRAAAASAGSPTQGTSAPSAPPVDIVKTVDEIVAQRLTQQEVQKQALQNTGSVVAAFSEKFGDQGEAEYIKLAQETGLSIASLNRLAATSPAAVLKLAGLTPKSANTTVPAKTGGSVNTEAFRNQNVGTTQSSAKIQGTKTSDLISAWRNAAPTN
jgi:hypothetical protein